MSDSRDPSSPADGGWGPTVRGRRSRRGRRVVVVVLLLLLVLPVAYGTALTLRLSSAIARSEVSTLSTEGSGPMHVLVTGSDSRADLSEEEQAELTTGSVAGERTDTIFVLTVSGTRAAILAFPRDLYVTRCDGSQGRINAALSIGGADCLVDTVEALSGLPLHHYMAVSFGGFHDIVEAAGGVRICVEQPIDDPKAGITLDEGCQVLDGAQGLGYVRTRQLDNDLQRIKRQQKFLGALASRLMKPAVVLNPPRAFSTVHAVGSALTADEGLGLVDLVELGLGARGLANGNAVTETVPSTPATIGGAAVLQVEEAGAQQLFTAFRTGEILDRATDGPTRASTQVHVLNGAGVAGLAGSTSDVLAERGYDVVGVGNAEATATTRIRYPAGQRANAELLAGDLPVEPTLEETDVGEVTLVLGDDLASGL